MKQRKIEKSTKIPLTKAQADVVRNMWEWFGDDGGATLGQVHWDKGKYHLRLRILTPEQFRVVNDAIKSLGLKGEG